MIMNKSSQRTKLINSLLNLSIQRWFGCSSHCKEEVGMSSATFKSVKGQSLLLGVLLGLVRLLHYCQEDTALSLAKRFSLGATYISVSLHLSLACPEGLLQMEH